MIRRAGIGLLACGLATSALAATLDAEIGARLFKRAWVPGISATTANDGLGPLHDARACITCHPRGGRAAVRAGGEAADGLGVRIDHRGAPDPVYGRHLSRASVPGVPAEGRAFARVSARGVDVDLLDPGYGPLSTDARLSLRVAPSMFGLQALASVPDAEIAHLADPDDRDGDGISGRLSRVVRPDGSPAVGRFGWKAANATLTDQIAAAFFADMGLSTTAFRDPAGECTTAQKACLAAPQGGTTDKPEMAPQIVAALAAYIGSLPPPVSKDNARGSRLFRDTGCAACHVPTLPDARGQPVPVFTDLLLHDMGPALAGDAEGGATSTEWRTAPLRGLSATLRAGGGLMHDARAPTAKDAILWHGGEAAGSVARFRALSPSDRAALIAYVEGL
jgi:CxxC motif-containing protein (DUF1111 family)